MSRKLFCVMVLGILLLTGFTQLSAMNNLRKTNDIGEQGIFEAELGRRANDEPVISINGNYQVKDRFTVIYGTATSGEKEGPFRGAFKGNHFVIRIPIRGRAITMIGRFNFNEDGNTFQGMWISRPVHIKGWITGTFIPT